MLATGTRTRRPFSSVRLSRPPSASAWRTVSDTCSGDSSDSSVISRATFCTPILTSTAFAFRQWCGEPADRRVAGPPRRLTGGGVLAFPRRALAVLDVGEAAQATPGQRGHEPRGLVARDGRALGQPEPGADLGHPRKRHAEQVRLGLGQAGVLADDRRDRLGA